MSYVLRKGQRWNLKSTLNSMSWVYGFLMEFSGLFSLSHCGTKTRGDAGHGGLGWRCHYLLGDFHGSSEMTAKGHPSLVLIGLEVEMAQTQVSGPKMHK